MDSEQLDISKLGAITYTTLLERLEKAEKSYAEIHNNLNLD